MAGDSASTGSCEAVELALALRLLGPATRGRFPADRPPRPGDTHPPS